MAHEAKHFVPRDLQKHVGVMKTLQLDTTSKQTNVLKNTISSIEPHVFVYLKAVRAMLGLPLPKGLHLDLSAEKLYKIYIQIVIKWENLAF